MESSWLKVVGAAFLLMALASAVAAAEPAASPPLRSRQLRHGGRDQTRHRTERTRQIALEAVSMGAPAR